MNSRAKGNRNEIRAAKAICRAAGLSPWREHIQTSRDVVGGSQQQQAGDLIPISDAAKPLLEPFRVIEVKADRKFSFDALMRCGGKMRDDFVLARWIRKARNLGDDGCPELIVLMLPRMAEMAAMSLTRFGRWHATAMLSKIDWSVVSMSPCARFGWLDEAWGIFYLDQLIRCL